jgi:hypothetical protein
MLKVEGVQWVQKEMGNEAKREQQGAKGQQKGSKKGAKKGGKREREQPYCFSRNLSPESSWNQV